MSIPARVDEDSDLVIGASLHDVPALVEEVRRLRAEARQDGRRLRWMHDALMQAPSDVSDTLGLPYGWTTLHEAIDEAMRQEVRDA